MRALLLTLATQLCACQAIVGTYEVGETTDTASPDAPQDSTAQDTSIADTAVADTSVPDSGLVVTSCKRHKELNPSATNGRFQIIPAGSPGYPAGLFAFCEMGGGGALTLVATRASNTRGTAWGSMGGGTPPPTVTKSFDLGPDDKDAYLAIDWTLLGGTEVIYDLGAPAGMGPAKSRISFRTLTTAQMSAGLMALTKSHPPTDRPNCYVEPSTTPIAGCIAPGTPPADPMKSFGWAYAPTGTLCYWGYADANGTLGCDGTTSGKGRVLIK